MMQLPDDAVLLAYLDGELDPQARKRLEKQLEGSWELRTRLAALERDIAACMTILNTAPQPGFAPADEVWRELETRLTPPAGQGTRRWMLAASLVLAGGLAAYLGLVRAPAVSAAELVARAADVEARTLQQVTRPVVHRKMRVRRLTARETRSVDWEVWTDPRSGLTHEQPDPSSENRALLGKLRLVMDQNRLDSRRPLSPQAWAAWRRGVKPSEERVEKAPGTVSIQTRLGAPEGESALVAARLTLRSSDWTPVSQEFTLNETEGQSTFEIEETSSAVVAFQSLPVGMFEPEAVPPAVHSASAPSGVEQQAPASLEREDPAQAEALLTSLLAANMALHKASLCGQVPLPELSISDGRVDVRGTVRTPEHKLQLLSAFGDIPLLRLDLQLDLSPAPAKAAVARFETGRFTEAQAAGLESMLSAIRTDALAMAWHIENAPEVALEEEPLRRVLEEHRVALKANLAEAAAQIQSSGPGRIVLPIPPGGNVRDRLLALASAASRLCADPSLSMEDLRATLLALSVSAE
jgi:anti-sigma factor RsiW